MSFSQSDAKTSSMWFFEWRYALGRPLNLLTLSTALSYSAGTAAQPDQEGIQHHYKVEQGRKRLPGQGLYISSTIVRTMQFSARTVEKNAEDSAKPVQKQVHGTIRLSFPSFDSAPNVFSQAQKAFGDLLLSIRLAFSQRSAQMSVQSRPFLLCDSHSSGP